MDWTQVVVERRLPASLDQDLLEQELVGDDGSWARRGSHFYIDDPYDRYRWIDFYGIGVG